MTDPVTDVKPAESKNSSDFSGNLSKGQIIGGLAVGVLGIAFAAGGFSAFNRGSAVRVLNCEMHQIQQCQKVKYPHYDCLFTNNSEVTVNPHDLKVWYYDAGNVLLDQVSLDAERVPPGRTIHVKFLQETSKKATTATICSVDPQSDLGRTLPITQTQG